MAETVLDRIVAAVRQRLEATPAVPDLRERAVEVSARRPASHRRSLRRAVAAGGPRILAECKRASPSAGVIRERFDPVDLARRYEAGGAAAVSVVVERDFFSGDPGWLAAVRSAVALPVLRKDFIIARRQLEETALLGADAVLLIQRILDEDALHDLVGAAHELGLEVLLELFVDEDPAPAAASEADLIGVNARDLSSFEVRLDRVEEVAGRLPGDRVLVAESGIRTPGDVRRLHAAGYGGFLVGEHLVRADDPAAEVRRLRGAGGSSC